VEAEEAAAKGDLGKSKMLYQEAADLFLGAISDVGGPRGISWLETGGETKVMIDDDDDDDDADDDVEKNFHRHLYLYLCWYLCS
jgi:hypothetical protein